MGHPGPYKDMFIPHRFLIAEQDKKLQNLGSSIKNVFHVEVDQRPANRAGKSHLLIEEYLMLWRLPCSLPGHSPPPHGLRSPIGRLKQPTNPTAKKGATDGKML